MSEKFRKNLVKYAIAFGVCLVYAAIHLFTRDPGAMERADLYRTLSDAFTVPGLICGFSGALVWLSNEGSLDGIGYVLQYAAKSLLFFGRRGPLETYKEYVERRQAKRTGGYAFLFVTGAVCLLIGTVFTALFYQMYR